MIFWFDVDPLINLALERTDCIHMNTASLQLPHTHTYTHIHTHTHMYMMYMFTVRTEWSGDMEHNTTFNLTLNRLTPHRLGVQYLESFPIYYSSTLKSDIKALSEGYWDKVWVIITSSD